MNEQENKDIEQEILPQESEEIAEQVDMSDELAKLQARVAELEDLRLRDLAEFENIKRRLEKEKFQSIAYAQEQFARDLLSVIDSLDGATEAMNSESGQNVEKIKEGIALTIEQFRKTFEKHGITLVDMACGFDPNFHEAVMQVPSETHEEGAIVQVFQKGYMIKERVLRPAMVSIAKK